MGIEHPSRLTDRMTSGELVDWWLAYHSEPWGDARADLRTAAGLAIFAGVRGWQPTWPYTETDADIIADLQALREEQDVGSSSDHCD